MHIRHAPHCPAAVLYGVASPAPLASAALDRARLQDLIDLLERYDLASDSADIGSLAADLRAFGSAVS